MPEDQHSLYLKLTESLIDQYRSVVSETRRKFVPIKEVTEKQISWLQKLKNSNEDLKQSLIQHNKQIIEPFLSGCATKNQKLVVICLTSLQKLISQECLSQEGARSLIDTLWNLRDSNMEELRVLQSAILLLTTSSLVRDTLLAKAYALCLRLHESKTTAIVNTASAAIRQCTSAVFDRVLKEDWSPPDDYDGKLTRLGPEEIDAFRPTNMKPAEHDAFRLFQDMCALVNDESATWLPGVVDINRSLGLELIESLIVNYAPLFRQHVAFAHLLKTSLCPLVIKLFSPSLKLRSTPSTGGTSTTTGSTSGGLAESASAALVAAATAVAHAAGGALSGASGGGGGVDKAAFPLLVRLKRLIAVIVEQYFYLLNTECEIFLSLLIRFLDVDKSLWQRALALEVLHKFAAQPDLIRHVCLYYDMRQHSTKIFQELINALSHYIQTLLANPSIGDELAKDANQASSGNIAPGPNQSLLYYRGSFFPVIHPKSFLIDMLDRTEVPALQDGYCLSLSITCLLCIVDSLKQIVEPIEKPVSAETNRHLSHTDSEDADMREQCLALSWCGLFSSLTLLLEASADMKITANLLHAIDTMTGLCGQLQMDAARDAFVMTLCKSTLPGPYAKTVFASTQPHSASVVNGVPTSLVFTSEDTFERSLVIAVIHQSTISHGTNSTSKVSFSAPTSTATTTTSSTPPSAGNAMNSSSSNTSDSSTSPTSSTTSFSVTEKHLQSARALLTAAQKHGNVLGTSWNMLLTTLQHLVWMLGLKIEPGAKLYFKLLHTGTSTSAAVEQSPSTNWTNTSPLISNTGAPIISASAAAELANLSAMLSALFTQSSKLEEGALNHLVLSLCNLSSQAMEAVSVNKEPSQFPVTKLTEVGLVNVHRLGLWWDSVCCQLLSMCKLAHLELRQLAANALVMLIKQAIAAPQTPAFWQNQTLTHQVLDPLSSLSEVHFDDVREKQLECVEHLLHCWGGQIGTSWLRLIEIIGVIRDSFKVDLIQTAFQCFKLIVTDYLSSLLPNCYPACVETAARFGHQKQDLNIALTAIGTILHLADHLLRLDKLPQQETHADDVATTATTTTNPSSEVITLPELWISIFCKLALLCSDRRPAIRKSACQTLFNTVECHGAQRFQPDTWATLFWKVLFPLVSNVHYSCTHASVERDDRQHSLLIHHSRDTAAKQWAETVVLTLSGVAQLVVSRQEQLLVLPEFEKIWHALLERIRIHALTSSAEISVTALTAFQILLDLPQSTSTMELWPAAWETWLQIGTSAVDLRGIDPDAVSLNGTSSVKSQNGEIPPSTIARNHSSSFSTPLFLPTTAFMTLLFDLSILLLSRTRSHLDRVDFQRLDKVIRFGVLTPLHVSYLYPQANNTSFIPLADDGTLSPLQESVLRCLDFLLQHTKSLDAELHQHLPTVLHLLLTLTTYAVHTPKPEQAGLGRLEVVPMNYITFSEKCLQLAVDTYLDETDRNDSSDRQMAEAIIRTLHKPMALKYACPSQSTWLLASGFFFKVITTVMPLVCVEKSNKSPLLKPAKAMNGTMSGDDKGHSLCNEIAQTLQDFLFYQHQPPSSLSVEEFQQHEELDCKFVNLISDLFLACPNQLPDFFISCLVNLLSLGSVQASVSGSDSECLSVDSPMLSDNSIDGDCHATQGSWHSRFRASIGISGGNKSDALITNGKRPKGGVGMAVRQSSETVNYLNGGCDPRTGTDGALNLDVTLDRLRQYAFRENFARLCFGKLLSHAFQPPENSDLVLDSEKSSNVSVTVSRAAVRSILQRCRLTLIQFYQAAQLTGKCPLPRARLVEIAYVFRALTAMLTSLQTVSSKRDVDPSTWNHVIDLYPHIVDCVLVTGGSPITGALHRLLRLYGDLLRPASIAPFEKQATR